MQPFSNKRKQAVKMRACLLGLTVKAAHIQWTSVDQTVAFAQFSGQKLGTTEEMDQMILVHGYSICNITGMAYTANETESSLRSTCGSSK